MSSASSNRLELSLVLDMANQVYQGLLHSYGYSHLSDIFIYMGGCQYFAHLNIPTVWVIELWLDDTRFIVFLYFFYLRHCVNFFL